MAYLTTLLASVMSWRREDSRGALQEDLRIGNREANCQICTVGLQRIKDSTLWRGLPPPKRKKNGTEEEPVMQNHRPPQLRRAAINRTLSVAARDEGT
jgi:hypothetical protein